MWLFFSFEYPFSVMCNSDAEGGKGEEMMHCIT